MVISWLALGKNFLACILAPISPYIRTAVPDIGELYVWQRARLWELFLLSLLLDTYIHLSHTNNWYVVFFLILKSFSNLIHKKW